jgi:hypothetical protein
VASNASMLVAATLQLTSASGDTILVDRSPTLSNADAVTEAQRIADFVHADLCPTSKCNPHEHLTISVTLGPHYCLADVALKAWYRCDVTGRPFRDDSDYPIITPVTPRARQSP